MFDMPIYYEFKITGDEQALLKSFDFITSYKATIEEDEDSDCYDDNMPTIDLDNGIVRFSFGTPDNSLTRLGFDAFVELTASEPSLRVMIQECEDSEYTSMLYAIENGQEICIENWGACLGLDEALLAVDLNKIPTPEIVVKTITLVAGMIKDSIDHEDEGFDYENKVLAADVLSTCLLNALTPALVENEGVALALRNLTQIMEQLRVSIEEDADWRNGPFNNIDKMLSIFEAADLDSVASTKTNGTGPGMEKTLRI